MTTDAHDLINAMFSVVYVVLFSVVQLEVERVTWFLLQLCEMCE